ncbi:hypothetical protein [Nonomuraea maritima]|uniref:hypothetical protein n=1 Tax=Nonomuraea maritima TaxID=683260 RepID=UPI00371E174A
MSAYMPRQNRALDGAVAGLAIAGVALIILGSSCGVSDSHERPIPIQVRPSETPTSGSTPPSITCEGDQCWWSNLNRPDKGDVAHVR